MHRTPPPRLAALRDAMARIESGRTVPSAKSIALGPAALDAALGGGLHTGALHDVYSIDGRQSAAATGFATALAIGTAQSKNILWIRQDFAAREVGNLAISGLADLGVDPAHLFVLHVADAATALRATHDALSCPALGAVVTELWGHARDFDLVASRKLTLAAAQSGVTSIFLRLAADEQPSTAETRWCVCTALSARDDDWGHPRFDVSLTRNRHGISGRWLVEWNADDRLFHEISPHSGYLVSSTRHRPSPPQSFIHYRAG